MLFWKPLAKSKPSRPTTSQETPTWPHSLVTAASSRVQLLLKSRICIYICCTLRHKAGMTHILRDLDRPGMSALIRLLNFELIHLLVFQKSIYFSAVVCTSWRQNPTPCAPIGVVLWTLGRTTAPLLRGPVAFSGLYLSYGEYIINKNKHNTAMIGEWTAILQFIPRI